jgi:hypothetical protein
MPISDYKYKEDEIIRTFMDYVNKTYSQHYKTENDKIECFDCWMALGDAAPTFRNTAMKYLWRVGKKGTKEDAKKDVLKVMHYCLLLYYAIGEEKENGETDDKEDFGQVNPIR